MEKQDEITPQDKFNNYLDIYLSNKRNNQDELEVRFGTKYYNPITKIDFENIISKLKSLGFRSYYASGCESYLNIQNEYADAKTGRMRMSNIRTTIRGLHNIQKYCKLFPFSIPLCQNVINFVHVLFGFVINALISLNTNFYWNCFTRST